jgi:hypothetical protein
MYKPPGVNSRWVALQQMDWNWMGHAKNMDKQGNWQLLSSRNPASSSWSTAPAEPEWFARWADGVMSAP